MFPGDDTVLFQDWDSRAYCLGLHNGTLLWKSGGRSTQRLPHPPYSQTWTDGGLLVGADGVAYAVSNAGSHDDVSTAYRGGGVHAHRLSDGEILWEAMVDHPVLTWPVSVKLEGDSSFTVFAFPGAAAHKNCKVWAGIQKLVLGHFLLSLPPLLQSFCLTAWLLAAGLACLRHGCRAPSARRCALVTGAACACACGWQGIQAWSTLQGSQEMRFRIQSASRSRAGLLRRRVTF